MTRAESQARTREALLDSAAVLFGRLGYQATSLDKVAERAGVTRGAVYSNFDSKEDLLLAVVQRVSHVMEHPVWADITIPFPQRVRLYARYLVEDWKRVREVMLLSSELELLAARNPKVRTRIARVFAAMYEGRGVELDAAAGISGVDLPMSGARWLQLTGAATRGLLRERLVLPDSVDERLLGDALLLLTGYDPTDHPMPLSD